MGMRRSYGGRRRARRVVPDLGRASLTAVLLATMASPTNACMHTFPAFFDFGSAEMTEHSRGAPKLVAIEANRRTPGCVMVTIHAHVDGAEAVAGFADLDSRRALAIRAYLETLGIAPAQMTIRTWGFQSPLARTEVGVKEPLNRKVDIGHDIPVGAEVVTRHESKLERGYESPCAVLPTPGVRLFLRDGTECIRLTED